MSTETTPLAPNELPAKQSLPSFKLRIAQVLCAVTWCLFAAGPVFGFAALKPVLVAQGVYKEVCDINTNGKSTLPCTAQDLKLNLMFTLAAVITNATALIVGRVLDTQGPRVTGIVGSIILAVSALLLANGKDIFLFDAYLFGYVGLAFGGPFVFISCFQLANSFPGNSGLVLALLTGAFDTSSALFLFYRIAYQNNYVINFTLDKFFSWYLIVPAFIFICQVFIMPHDSYKTVGTLAKIGETGIDENGLPLDPNDSRFQEADVSSLEEARNRRSSVKSNKSVYEEIADGHLKSSSGGIFGVLHTKSVLEQCKTPWWYLMVAFTTIQMLRINYFVATVRSQMTYYFDLETAVQMNRFFDVALPLGGIFSIPFIGIILDNTQTLTTLKILFTVSFTIGLSGIVSNQFIQYFGILLLVVYRPFYYTAVSDYCAKVFGFTTFGTVYGAMICISGLMNVLQTGMDNLTHFTFEMNPTPVNIGLVLLTTLFGFSMIYYVRSQEQQLKRQQAIDEAIGE